MRRVYLVLFVSFSLFATQISSQEYRAPDGEPSAGESVVPHGKPSSEDVQQLINPTVTDPSEDAVVQADGSTHAEGPAHPLSSDQAELQALTELSPGGACSFPQRPPLGGSTGPCSSVNQCHRSENPATSGNSGTGAPDHHIIDIEPPLQAGIVGVAPPQDHQQQLQPSSRPVMLGKTMLGFTSQAVLGLMVLHVQGSWSPSSASQRTRLDFVGDALILSFASLLIGILMRTAYPRIAVFIEHFGTFAATGGFLGMARLLSSDDMGWLVWLVGVPLFLAFTLSLFHI